MPGELVPIILGSVFFISVAYAIKVISDNRARKELLQTHATAEVAQKLFLENRAPDYETALKWGMVVFAVGLAFAVIGVSDLGPGDAMSYALLLLFGGGSMIIYNRIRKPTDQ